MFWKKRKCPIEQDILDFATNRRHYGTTNTQVVYIRQFVKTIGVQKFEDIHETDIDSYLDSIKNTIVRESERIQIAQSLFLFLRFKKIHLLQTATKQGRGRPENTQRNYAIVALRQLQYTYDEIARKYKLNKRTVYDIVKRIENKE